MVVWLVLWRRMEKTLRSSSAFHSPGDLFQLQLLWQEIYLSQYFHYVLISSASFLLLATPLSTCSVLTLKELRFRFEKVYDQILKVEASTKVSLVEHDFFLSPGSRNNTLGDFRH